MGRSKYTAKLGDEIVNRISEGETLRAICRDKKIHWSSVYDWLDKDPDFSRRIARARELGFDAIAQDLLEIADTPKNGEIVEVSKDGKKVRREDMLGHRKLQVDTRLKLLAKWCPARYGERSTIDANLNDATLTPTEREARVNALLASAHKRSLNEPDDDGSV